MDNIVVENLLLVCSICLDSITDYKERSIAKLKCGHQFHLDCIGSAFNMTGEMMCPNCRKIEVGRWLYANESDPSVSDFDEDPYEYLFTGDPTGLLWHRFSGLTGGSLFEQVESLLTPNHELPENHAIYAEHMGASPPVHSHENVSRVPSAISNASENVDDHIFNHRRNGQSAQNELYNPFLAANVQYQTWDHNLSLISANRNHHNGVDHVPEILTQRTTRVGADTISRSGPSALPFQYGVSTFPRGGGSFISSLNHRGSITCPHERIQVSHVIRPPQGNPSTLILPIMPGVERFSDQMGMLVLTPAPPQGGINVFSHSGGQTLHEETRDHLSRFPVMSFNRDSGWDSHRLTSGGSDPSHSSSNFWPQ